MPHKHKPYIESQSVAEFCKMRFRVMEQWFGLCSVTKAADFSKSLFSFTDLSPIKWEVRVTAISHGSSNNLGDEQLEYAGKIPESHSCSI